MMIMRWQIAYPDQVIPIIGPLMFEGWNFKSRYV